MVAKKSSAFLIKALALGSYVVGLASQPAAAACTYTIDRAASKLTWTAYKTPAKAAVKGSFNDITFSFKEKAASVKEALESVKFELATNKISTGDPARDLNIQNSLFNLSSATKGLSPLGTISGSVVSYNEAQKTARAKLVINGKTVEKDFAVTSQGDELSLHSELNLLTDFAMEPYVAALAKACEALHAGKTWPDVGLLVTTKIPKSC